MMVFPVCDSQSVLRYSSSFGISIFVSAHINKYHHRYSLLSLHFWLVLDTVGKDAGPLKRSVNLELTSPRLRKSLTALFSSSDFSIYQPAIEVVDPSGFTLNGIQNYKQAGCRQTSRKYAAIKRCNGKWNDQGATCDIGKAQSASALPV